MPQSETRTTRPAPSRTFERRRRKIIDIAGALEDQRTIPVIAEQLELIHDIQADEWWANVSYPMLEEVRSKLRLLVPLIERSKKGVIYSDAEADVCRVGCCVGQAGLLQAI